MEFPDLSGVQHRCCRTAQALTVLAGVVQASPYPFSQDVPFEFSENSEQTGHSPARWRGQVQRLGQRDETDTEMFQFLESCQ